MNDTAASSDAAILQDLNTAAHAGEIFSAADMPAGAVTQQQGPVVDQAVAGMIAGALVVTFGLLAKQRGSHWAVDADTAQEVGTAYAIVIQKYFPAFSGGPEFAAVMITVALIAPRVLMDKAAAAAQKEALDGSQSE